MAKVWRKRYQAKRTTAKRFDRLTFLNLVILLFVGVVTFRLFTLQVMQHSFYEALASGQHDIYEKLIAERGEVFVRDRYSGDQLYKVAANKKYQLVFAVPKKIKNPEETAELIAPILDVEVEEILPRLQKEDDLYEPLKRRVSDDVVQEIKDLGIEGIEYSDESYRYYPEGKYFSHVLGFVGYQDDTLVGRYGIEGYFEEELAGRNGFFQAQMDSGGRWITIGDTKFEEATNGTDYIMTIDRTVQFTACDLLSKAVEKHGADSGSVVILNPKTGAVIAMCNVPDYDPNKYNEVEDSEVYTNKSIYHQYEPGSVFKPLTMAGAINEDKVGPNTKYIDEGSVEIDKYTIRNADNKVYGEQTMTQVLEESINTGAIYAAQQIGNAKFYEYVKDFGFGQRTNITLDSETAGDISTLERLSDIYAMTASFGHGITVTPLQLASAYAAIANGGKLMQTYIIDETISDNGNVEKTEPVELKQVISNKSAATLGAMLVRVVENGHGKKAGVEGYYIAGKTGTAQIPFTDRVGYDPNRTIGTFAGFGPVDDPVFAMVVKIDVPKDVIWAESSAAPLFGDIAEFLLNYYEVPPTRQGE
ncbi:penicillin-binding protein 2 [Patescibacteria group bacterium]|nr:penicillin-binding protein 2 [Patescibacteria group bacterium]MBU1890751.1 penicillin-binding protein 2 [Patescibacteria group bacterium]